MASEELFDCMICLQILEDPVTTACGHTFCMTCINTFWDGTGERNGFSCPQCRETFKTRPALKKNTLLAELIMEQRDWMVVDTSGKNSAGSSDVQCDACKGIASMFCVVCLASFCEIHLKSHFEVPPLKKHKLIQARARNKDNICVPHHKLKEIHCRTDGQFICPLCAVNEHQGHDTVSIEAEKCDMQRQLAVTKQEISDKLLVLEANVNLVKKAADSVRDAAWEVYDDFERACEEHIRLYTDSVRGSYSEVRAKVADEEKVGLDWISCQLRQLQRQAFLLRKRHNTLHQVSQTENPIQFVQNFQALDNPSVSTAANIQLDQLDWFITNQKKKLKDLCTQENDKLRSHFVEMTVSNIPVDVTATTSNLLLACETRVEVDPNTVIGCLCLSDKNRTISWTGFEHAQPDHPERFTYFYQALCKNSLKGEHYWEVQWDCGIIEVAVSYRNIRRKGSGRECCFGHNDLSWKLVCFPTGCTFWHNNICKACIPPARMQKVGVHLHHKAGTLAFYSICNSDRPTLLHRIQTAFTEPLYPGFCLDLGSTLKICSH